MDPVEKYEQSSPWPERNEQQVLFLLDARNSFEQDILKQWIHHNTSCGNEEFQAPQVCLDLG